MRIAIALYSFSGFAEAALRGIAAYARPRLPWSFDHGHQTLESVRQLLARKPAGLLTSTDDPALCQLLNEADLPVVNMHYSDLLSNAGHVSNDDHAVGLLAARYLLAHGYRNFAYYAELRDPLDQRLRGFEHGLALQQHKCEAFKGAPPSGFSGEDLAYEARVQEWLETLPKPLAVFCVHDHLARLLCEVCVRAKLSVPEQVAILGVDNDLAICSLANPPLSSVQTGTRRIGYEAAQLLHQMLENPGHARRTVLVPPVRVITRTSTDTFSTSDTFVLGAVAHMRNNLNDSEGIDLLCDRLHCSRRTLERRFRESLGITPAQAWFRLKFEEAERLLAETDLKLQTVADLSGFTDSKRLIEVFRRVTGATPGQFRRLAAPEASEAPDESG